VNLDLDSLLGDWDTAGDQGGARVIRCPDGAEFVQLRVDLGLLQMHLDGRPDGQRYRGLPTVYEYFEHETRVGRALTRQDWRELRRELQQYNYRRLACSSLAEEALRAQQIEPGRVHLHRALRDIDHCLAILRTLRASEQEWDSALLILEPTLIFNRVRLLTRLHIAENRPDEAIEEAERGIRELDQALVEAGYDDEQREANPALAYLAQLSRRLREQHGIALTLKERLDRAIECEDFETAARLRDELRRRGSGDFPPARPSAEAD